MDRINGADTVDIGGGRRGFRDEDLPTGQIGTEVTAAWLNMVQEELLKVITEAGLTPSSNDWSQLWTALQNLGLGRSAIGRAWLSITSSTVTAPPASPVKGDIYLVPIGATGVWAGQVGKLAEWTGTEWSFGTTPDGHGISLPDGRVFEKIGGVYTEFLASRSWVLSRTSASTKLNRLPWLPVISMTTTAPPASPAQGDAYLVPTGASGAWSANAGKIAEWVDGAWSYATPTDGHGISLPNGLIFERIGGSYIQKLALDAQSGKWHYAQTGGTANALTATLSPAPTAYSAGMRIFLNITQPNTGPVTLNVNGLGAFGIWRRGGVALQPGDLLPGIVELVHNGSNFTLLSPQPAGTLGRGIAVLLGTENQGLSGTWTVPNGVTEITIEMWGGGGGGSGNNGAQSGAGGGGGGYAMGVYGVTPGTTYAYTVGGGGAAGAAGSGPGGNGGTTSFGALMSAAGGLGASTQSNPGTGGNSFVGADYFSRGQGGNGAFAGTTTGAVGCGGDAGGGGGKGGTGGQPPTNPGGGGAGALQGAGNVGGNGYAGGIVIRWRS